jgi:negative regulator of flagellin synthesis FlgM
MNINRINPLETLNSVTKSEAVKQASPTNRGESITISTSTGSTEELLAIRTMALSAPDVREDKIAEIRAKLANPNYINDTLLNNTADKIIEFYRL